MTLTGSMVREEGGKSGGGTRLPADRKKQTERGKVNHIMELSRGRNPGSRYKPVTNLVWVEERISVGKKWKRSSDSGYCLIFQVIVTSFKLSSYSILYSRKDYARRQATSKDDSGKDDDRRTPGRATRIGCWEEAGRDDDRRTPEGTMPADDEDS